MHFFPQLQKDELLYSGIARFHKRSGNLSFIHTVEDVFGVRSSVFGIEFPARIKNIADNFGEKSNEMAHNLVDDHTLLKYYTAFKEKSVYGEVSNLMINSSGKSIHMKLGLLSSNNNFHRKLMFCPKCAEEEISRIGFPYWHRDHQIYGVFICKVHLCELVPSNINRFERNRQSVHTLEEDLVGEKITKVSQVENSELLQHITEQIYFSTTHRVNCSIKAIKNKLRILLYEKGYARQNNYVFIKRLKEDFKLFFNRIQYEFFDETDNLDWVAEYVRDNERAVQPLRMILLLTFLGESVQGFFDDIDEYKEINAQEYLKEIWEEKVVKLCKLGLSQRQIISELSTTRETLLKAIVRLEIDVAWKDNGGRRYAGPYTETEEFKIKKNELESKWKRLHEELPTLSSNQIRKQNDSVYNWLNKYSKDWLKNNYRITNPTHLRVDWKKRDDDYLEEVRKTIKEFKNNVKTRVTWGTIGGELGISGWFTKEMPEMKKCKELVNTNCETLQEYHLRCLRMVAEEMNNNGVRITKYGLLEGAGVKTRFIEDVEEEFTEYDMNTLNFKSLLNEKA